MKGLILNNTVQHCLSSSCFTKLSGICFRKCPFSVCPGSHAWLNLELQVYWLVYFTRYCSSYWRCCSTCGVEEIWDRRNWLDKPICPRTKEVQPRSKYWSFWRREAERAVCMLRRRSVSLWCFRELMRARNAHSSRWTGWLFTYVSFGEMFCKALTLFLLHVS